MNKRLKCTECGNGRLHPATWTGAVRHRDLTLHVADLECHRCDACGSDPVFTDQIRRNQRRIADARRSADGLLTGDEIRGIRELLGLTQAQAGELIGGGPMAFSKYERGEVIQSVGMDKFLRVLAMHPFLLETLRSMNNRTPVVSTTAD